MTATLRKFETADYERLVRMYNDFDPKGEFQGLPPRTPDLITRWLTALVKMEDEQFVIDTGQGIVGHSMLCFSSDKTEAELAMFMHQNFRGFGLGRKLLLGTLNHGCKQRELDRVWLSVQGCNPRALHLFETAGFNAFCSRSPLQWELDMERPSHCEQCKGDACVVFGAALPCTVKLPREIAQRSR